MYPYIFHRPKLYVGNMHLTQWPVLPWDFQVELGSRTVAPDAANAESQCPATDAANAEAEEVILNKGHGVPV